MEKYNQCKEKLFEIPEDFLNTGARLGKPLENNVIEARITYKRNPDKKIYIKSAYYFINPDGLWVGENNASIEEENYVEIKNFIKNHTKIDTSFFDGDILHDSNINDLN